MKTKKPYWEMTTRELREATREFDRPGEKIPGKALTAAQRARFERVVKRGRPVVGLGAEKIRVSVERGLLKQADRLAEKLHVSRSELIADGLRKLLKSV